MRIFEHFNETTDCFICGKNHDGKTVLLPVDGAQEGNNIEAKQVHFNCLDLRILSIGNDTPAGDGSKHYIIHQVVHKAKEKSA